MRGERTAAAARIGPTGDDYQRWTRTTAIYPQAQAVEYLIAGLCSEAGEVAALRKRALRDRRPITREAMTAELGDVLWYVARLADECGISLGEVMRSNRVKLDSRARRGALGGEGDHR